MKLQSNIAGTSVRRAFLGLGAALALILAAPGAQAETIKANVPFSFNVGPKTLPAGNYSFNVNLGARSVAVEGGKQGAEELIMTTIAARPYAEQTNDAHVVFDKVGSKYTLSELWEPGQDGVLVHATKGPHEHHVIRVKR